MTPSDVIEGREPDLFPETIPPDDGLERDERYTPRETMEWVKRVAGVDAFDLDAAACEESHKAEEFYTRPRTKEEAGGLELPWFGRSFVNPPFSDIGAWVGKAWAEFQRRDSKLDMVAMLIPCNRSEQGWWQELIEPYRDGKARKRLTYPSLTTHYLPGRTRFGHPGNPEGVGVGSPNFGCVLLVWKRHPSPGESR